MKQAWIIVFMVTAAFAFAQAQSATMKQIMLDLIHPASNEILLSIYRGGPKDDKEWAVLRRSALTLAESGNLLLARRPPKGSLTGWRQRATDFRAEAEVLLHAIERHDFRATQDALRKLPQSCAACHADYR